MSKRIWIGLASFFLILVLVLGIQMLNSGPAMAPAPEPELENAESTQSGFHLEEEPEIKAAEEKEPDLETEEIDPETPAELEEAAEIPKEQPTPTETDAQQAAEPPAETRESEEPTSTEEGAKHVTLSVSVKTLLDKEEAINPEKWELVPEDGWIFPAQKVEFYEGESVFNVLLREMKKNKIHMEYVMTPIHNSNYIEGIGNIYEFDCGELSGWMYSVNDISPSLGTSNYLLKEGDTVRLLYTCDLGRDLGFEFDE
ncbi:DUF4430 domain-containing protein [Gudongella sp. DL1XJH-153]|uniref:DUF4430 domain-containing protein n=1 Tax=Gudongella sp. DL1XJH-153 TaxID=3409804 RepID=UPI003BB5DD04